MKHGNSVLTDDTREQLFVDLELGSSTIRELAEKYGVSYQRIHQLENKWMINKGNRITRRSAKTLTAKIKDENFEEAYNFVWREAVRRGYVVKAWAAWNGVIYRRALFINGRRVWVSRGKKAIKSSKDMNYGYYRFSATSQGTRIVVTDDEPNLRFYILLNFFPDRTKPMLYIPAQISTYRSAKNRFKDCLNAWHLLAPNNGIIAHASEPTASEG